MPFRFDSPEGPMEITVRRRSPQDEGGKAQQFAAAVTYRQSGPRALERILLSARAETHHGALEALTEGFKCSPGTYEKDTAEFRVLTALCTAQGVVELNP